MDNNADTQRLTSFTNAYKEMIAASEQAYDSSLWWGSRKDRQPVRTYTLEEIEQIIESGSVDSLIKLSRNYFYKSGYYRRIILHYATILKYIGMLIPNPSYGKNLSEQYINKRYFSAVDFVDRAEFPAISENIAVRALRDGCYYGLVQSVSKKGITILDLPTTYCASHFKDSLGRDIIEFNVTYFNTIVDKKAREGALSVYPKVISNWYRRYSNGKVKTPWVYVPASIGICIPFIDGKPSFLNIIPATIKYEKTIDTNMLRDMEEIRKILVQKIPHFTDGGLLFEPDEAVEIHRGAVNMLKGNPNISVLTSYADVDAIVSKTSNDNATSTSAAALNGIYTEAGTSSNLFGTDSNLALETSLNNDLALMMPFVHKLEKVFTSIINGLFANSNIDFTYKILPITYYNNSKFIEDSFKLANAGYSFLLPALASGLSQKQICSIKDLENDVLELQEKLIPLSLSYTTAGGEGTGKVGRPKKDPSDMSEKTEANQESLDRGGSTSNGD